jgi:outer membrane murein-binding lipoprotein Lpp
MIKKRTVQWIAVLLTAMLTGCGGGREPFLWNDMNRLKAENRELAMQVEQLKAQTDQLSEQIETLSGLDGDARMQELDTLVKVRLGKRTGLYDMDKDGTNETLVVYVEPLDRSQDYVKAVGRVEVELWNLDAPPAEARLADWTLAPDEIQKHWGGTIFTGYYRLLFPVAEILNGQEKKLTVRVTFTDWLSGKVLRDQTTITP